MSKEHVWTGLYVTSKIFYNLTGPWTGQVVNEQDSWTVCQTNMIGQDCMELLGLHLTSMIVSSLGQPYGVQMFKEVEMSLVDSWPFGQ